ncbi:hypothetical protein TWF281_004046 [Arthrobotrys megalospora]
MAKSGSIELQIAHGATPMPFMVPLKKAADRQVLEELVRRRAKCASDAKITMYARGMAIIDWDDWVDLIEPGQWYLADINDSWIAHSRGLGHGNTTSSFNIFIGEIEKGKTPALASASIPDTAASQSGAPAAKPAVPVADASSKPTAPLSSSTAAKKPITPSETQINAPGPTKSNSALSGSAPLAPPGIYPARNRLGFPIPVGTATNPIGRAGMGHGILHPDEEKEVVETLHQQVNTLAVEKPVAGQRSSGVQSTASTITRDSSSGSDESQEEVHGGVKLEAHKPDLPPISSGPTASAGGSGAPATVKANSPSTRPEKDQPVSAKPTVPKPGSGQPTPVKSTVDKTATALAPAKPTENTSSQATATAKTEVSGKPAVVKPSPAKIPPPQQNQPDNSEETSDSGDSRPENLAGSPPEVIQGNIPQDGQPIDISDEEESETYETIEAPASPTPTIEALFPTPSGLKSISSSNQNERGRPAKNPRELLEDKNRLTFFLVKPKNKDKPIAYNHNFRIFLSTTADCCPTRLLRMLGKNPNYTRLIVLVPSADQTHYITTDIVNPGSRISRTPFKVVGWGHNTALTWEHIENDEEEENIDTNLVWDEPDMFEDDEEEEEDDEGDEDED